MKIFYLSLFSLLTSCGFGYTAVEDSWVKYGSAKLDMQKTAMECGMNDPYFNGAFGHRINLESWEATINYYALAEQCLIKSGYYKKYPINATTCEKFSNLPACQPGAEIPKRSVERRLNSRYCRLETDYQFCKANAKLPEKCGEPPNPVCDP